MKKKDGRKWVYILVVSLILSLLVGESVAEGYYWFCPSCGRKNSSNFCPVDGVKKPEDIGTQSIGLTYNRSVDLTSLTPYYEGAIQVFTSSVKDTLGNRYETGIRGYMDPEDPDCFSIWDIDRKYSELTATCIIREKDKGSKYKGSFYIYGDNELLYKAEKIPSTTKPFPISIDIRGVTDLKIEMYGDGNTGFYGINSVLVDIMLHP